MTIPNSVMGQKMQIYVKALETKHVVTVIMDILNWEENAYKVTFLFSIVTITCAQEIHNQVHPIINP